MSNQETCHQKKDLMNLVEQMAQIANKINDKWNSINKIEENELEYVNLEMKRIRLKHMVDIAMEKDEKGKKKYSNQKLRDAELFFRLENDVKYKNLINEKNKIHERMAKIKAEYDSLVVEYNKIKAIILIFSGKDIKFDVEEIEYDNYFLSESWNTQSSYFERESELNEIINVDVEETTDLEAWRDILSELEKEDVLFVTYSMFDIEKSPSGENYIDKNRIHIIFVMPKILFYKWLDVFEERVEKGDIISVLSYNQELQSLLEKDVESS